ncbi:MAG: tetratricopeptide repeat protein [Acidobacteria bacterium]|nr:tetratricopeptide repeat protein [Acidobacteriota bacterium]
MRLDGMSRAEMTISALILFTALGWAGLPGSTTGQEPGRSPSLDALKRGFVAAEKGDHEEAIVHFGVALERASTSELRFQALVALGSAETALGRLEPARKHFEQALEIKPGHAEALFSLGLIAKGEGKYQEAISLFAAAAVRDPSLGEALVELGVVYELLERHEEAAEACWKAVTVLPEDRGALLCLGVARYHLGLYQGAAQAFEAVIEMEPDNIRALYGLGLAKLYLEDFDGAMEEYLSLKPLDAALARDLLLRIPQPD